MKAIVLALAFIGCAASWRVAIVYQPALFNIAPVTALAFCAAAYFRDWRLWLVPFAALTLSDLWLNHYHASQFGYTWSINEMVLRAGCIAVALGIGSLVARRRNVLTLLAGSIASSLIFYAGTNSVHWYLDPFYAKNAAGWWQALTVGHPEFPPTLWFFRNTLAGDLLFTGLFAIALEFTLARDARVATQRVSH